MRNILKSLVIRSLIYSIACTRANLPHKIGMVSRFFANYGKEHWKIVKWILRYLRGTSKFCLCFGCNKLILERYTDSDIVGDNYIQKSIL